MSKTKQRERSEVEHLRGKIRELESENRQLRKRLKRLDKQSHLYEDIIDAVAEEIEVPSNNCEKCKNGVLQTVDLKYARFVVCQTCKERKKL